MIMPLEKLSKRIIDFKKAWVVVDFIHEDKNHYYYSVVNKMSGSRLSAFDGDAPFVDNSLKEVKAVLTNIKNRAPIIKVEGSKTLLDYFNKVKPC